MTNSKDSGCHHSFTEGKRGVLHSAREEGPSLFHFFTLFTKWWQNDCKVCNWWGVLKQQAASKKIKQKPCHFLQKSDVREKCKAQKRADYNSADMFQNQNLWKMHIAFFAKNEDVVFMYNEYILETPLIHICFTIHYWCMEHNKNCAYCLLNTVLFDYRQISHSIWI